jgi:hypothetical protein
MSLCAAELKSRMPPTKITEAKVGGRRQLPMRTLRAVFIAQADVLGNWTTNQITTNSVGLKHIVYSDGLYVATGELGDGGEIYSSEEGFHWTLRFDDGGAESAGVVVGHHTHRAQRLDPMDLSAKAPETRARRVHKACAMLAAGKRRVCCFDQSGFYSKSLSSPKAAI